MTRSFVQSRFYDDHGQPKPQGLDLKRDYEAGAPVYGLLSRYDIGDRRTLSIVLDKLGAKRRTRGQDGGISTFRLMRLYAEHRSCAAVAKALGIDAFRVYQRLRRAGWTELRDAHG